MLTMVSYRKGGELKKTRALLGKVRGGIDVLKNRVEANKRSKDQRREEKAKSQLVKLEAEEKRLREQVQLQESIDRKAEQIARLKKRSRKAGNILDSIRKRQEQVKKSRGKKKRRSNDTPFSNFFVNR
jgi:ATP-dependent 26S proteasome regulatory subunit